jgi:1-aminocyclopropane-1-carboxylate deaminase/D-cysteine desulfhydrase-like pyridoxal-dependent ACC family enzyme
MRVSVRIAIVIDQTNFTASLPRFHLTDLPTPIDRATRLEDAMREQGARPPRIFVKRDDLLGLAFGGNKIRNLEFSIGAALSAGATDVVTVGRAQSNHCRLTAAACARAGLRAHAVMSGPRPAAATGNLLLTELLGANVHFTGSDDCAARESLSQRIVNEINDSGGRAHFVPVGGSDPAGAAGHALAAAEIVQQMRDAAEPLDAIVLATATGGTQAGILAGLRRIGTDVRVLAFTVNKPASEARQDVGALANEVAMLIGGSAVDALAVRVDGSQLGGGYGEPTAAGRDAIRLLARTEGMLLDPTYTAKAFAGLTALAHSRAWSEDQGVVFIHTGGAPVLFT